MPQELQIVPKWLQPHVMTVINDNTQFDDSVSTQDDNVKFLAVFRSSQGPDNMFIKKTKLNDFFRTYGTEDYKKYGQPLMMPIAELEAGQATVYCMRVMPEDAGYSNAILSLLYKKDEENGKFVIKFTSDYATEVTTPNVLELKALGLEEDLPDADGFVKVPLINIRMSGRGVYGDKFRFRIAHNFDYEKDYKIKMFSFEAITAASGLTKVANYVGSIITSPRYNASTLINDVIDEAEAGSSYFDIRVNEDNLERVYNEFVSFVEALPEDKRDTIPTVDEFDPFFGLKVASTELNTNMEILTGVEGAISVDTPEGNVLAGGTDGAFDEKADPIAREAAITKAYCDAFEGVTDREILSPARVPITVFLDAQYPYDAKVSLANLANLRESSLLYLDSGIITNTAEIENLFVDYAQFNTRNISKDFQYYLIRDRVTKKKIAVSTTFFYARKMAAHIKTYGNHVPFVKKYAMLTGHVKNSLKPAIELMDMELKEKLYENRFNYWETVEEDVFQKGCQNTSQNINSDLLEENNMHVLFEMKRILEKDANDNLYNFANAENRKQFKEYEEAKFANWIGRKVETFTIDFQMNEWEAERSILHCYVGVQFRTLNKRTIIEIDVNKRNFSS